MSGIFISYRRDDSGGYAGRIYDRLSRKFGEEAVFRDIGDIAPGENYIEVVERNLAQAEAVLVVIGPRWLDIRDAEGRRRLDNPDDLVRREVELALENGAKVIPLLVGRATMPDRAALPQSIQRLANCNAVQLHEDTFDYEIEQLNWRIGQVTGRARFGWKRIAIGASLLVACAAAYIGLRVPDLTAREPSQTIGAALTVARTGDYASAWKNLEGVKGAGARTAREDIAMLWARNVRLREGGQFGAITERLTPVLAEGASGARGQRKADLLAHLGWCTFLQRRDTGAGDPEPFYRQALEADAANPFANAMLAHWLLWKGADRAIEETRKHFAAALASRREPGEVRKLQLAAYSNLRTGAAQVEYVRALNDARKQRDALDDRSWNGDYSIYYIDFRNGELRRLLTEAMPPGEHVETIRRLAESLDDQAQKRLLECWVGRLEEAAGHGDAALAAYRRAERGLKADDAGPVPDEIRVALKRLSK